ncbi:MAG: NADH:ubiquinone reductase (Na(+)-transporting) subunit C [Bacteroides sp.]
MNTNSNSYTIIYASVMVVVVAFVLAFTSASLKDTQNTNVELDKKKQILSALNIPTQGQDAAALYNQYVKQDIIINSTGETVKEEGGFGIDVDKELAKPLAERELPIYVCEVNGAAKYVLPLRGKGLWGAIWGYVGLDEDKNTVYGTYFSHASETPGLGAEIATESFQKPFIGKHILNADGQFVSIAVVKPGKTAEGQDSVDGISGGTITSSAVSNMMLEGLGQYDKFLTNK